ncbi:phage antirepressor N-terminal domain-containing protein [Flaviflexus massiliensis]|uniref:phage antirepressor N-terminal domain-containing protein n=1 Tax=Flaviflexus massiliensis TaxID=1522309 RepID=UPI0006D58BBB|nr:phage antirepressor N-terminal domain-containing protein [Flaviflexus massiliensis]
MSHLTAVPFHGTNIHAIKNDDGIHVAVRPICESLGIQADAQVKRLKREPWAVTSIKDGTGNDGKRYQMTFVDRRTFTMWLATIQTSRIKNEAARELLEAYQCEAADALDKYFHEGGVINPRASEHQVNAIIRQAQMKMELCQAAKGLIHADHLEARARIVLAEGLGENPVIDQAKRPLYVQAYLEQKNLSTSQLRKVAGTFGKRLKAAYTLRHGKAPDQYPLQIKNGQIKNVNAYTEADRPLMDEIWTDYYAQVI